MEERNVGVVKNCRSVSCDFLPPFFFCALPFPPAFCGSLGGCALGGHSPHTPPTGAARSCSSAFLSGPDDRILSTLPSFSVFELHKLLKHLNL